MNTNETYVSGKSLNTLLDSLAQSKTELIKKCETGATRMPFNILMFYAELKRNNGNYKSKKK